MSILSHSKASLRGSQPFPDPAFPFQPHVSFSPSFAAETFWCLWLWVGFFSCFLHCFSGQVGDGAHGVMQQREGHEGPGERMQQRQFFE